MYDRDTVELALYALEDGMTLGAAARLVGASRTAVGNWAAGRLPHERASGRIRVRTKTVEVPAVNAEERAAYDAAMEENALLKAVLDDLKAEGSAPATTSRRRCVALGERLRAATGLPLTRILAFLGISKSSYEYHRARLGADRDAALRPLVAEAFEACGRRGYRAVWAQLRRGGVRASEKVVRRLMREQGLTAARRRRRRWSSYAGEASPAPPNLPLRADGTHDFGAARPNELWVTDITEFRIPPGEKCYLSPVIDCFDGRPVGWSIGPRPTAELADSSLESACGTLSPGEAPAVHSDRGGHYRWPRWVEICEANGLARSMSRKGRSGDNARAEGFFGLLKQEFFYPRDWSGVGIAEFMSELDAWMRWFRSGRISQALGWLTPDEHRLALGYAL
ncbi:MAG: IS3 family transposase [Coriobacteriaceae bacterium]|nr:IS3 family transposase [Coriobacteriaceae bacterium]